MDVEPSSVTLAPRQPILLKAIGTFDNSHQLDLTIYADWVSSNPNVATVVTGGVEPLLPGTSASGDCPDWFAGYTKYASPALGTLGINQYNANFFNDNTLIKGQEGGGGASRPYGPTGNSLSRVRSWFAKYCLVGPVFAAHAEVSASPEVTPATRLVGIAGFSSRAQSGILENVCEGFCSPVCC